MSQSAETPKQMKAPSQEHQGELAGREILRVAELKLAMVEYTDVDHPNPTTRMIAILPATEYNPEVVYFLDDKIVGRPAQSWFSTRVITKLKSLIKNV